MKIKELLIILSLLILFYGNIKFINGYIKAGLFDTEYDCMLSLDSLIVPAETIPIYDDFDKNKDYCGTEGILCVDNQISRIVLTQTSVSTITPIHFNCFLILSTVSIKNIKTPFQDLITYSYSNTLLKSMYFSTDLSSSIISSPVYLDTIELTANQQTKGVINISNLLNVNGFSYYISRPSSGSFDITYFNDLGTSIWKPQNLYLTSTSVPNFTNIISTAVTLEIMPVNDMVSINQNIVTVGGITSFQVILLEPYVNLFEFPSNFNNLRPTTSNFVTFKCPFVKPASYIDISGSTIDGLTILTNRSFHLNGEFPLILSNSLKQFSMSGSILKQLDYSKFKLVQTLYLSNNSIQSTLPSMNPNLNVLDISLNNISGIVDRSYCKLRFISMSFNQLSGELPSCFTCFYAAYKNYLQSNLFSNYDNPPPCTTILPNTLGYSIYNGDTYVFTIEGYDLGPYDLSGFLQITGNNLLVDHYTLLAVIPHNRITFSSALIDSNLGLPETITLNYNVNLNSLSFIMAVVPKPPKTSSVLWSNNQLTFTGSFYTYDKSNISITIGNQLCLIQESTFNTITCSISTNSEYSNVKTLIKIGTLSNQITLTSDIMNTVTECLANCPVNSFCNTEIGECVCEKDWQGSDCSIPFVQCPLATDNNEICGNRGSCFNQTGTCTCDNLENNSPSCSECIDPLCGNNGKCNYSTATCQCNKGAYSYEGSNCTIPSIYVSSIDSSFEDGGNATFYGWFGLYPLNSQIKVYINEKECSIFSINNTVIICSAQRGTGLASVIIEHPLISWTKSSIYKYQSKSIKCLNSCNNINGGGLCNNKTGYCLCNNNWDGLDCSIKLNENNGGTENPTTNTTVNGNTGIVNFNNQNTNYTISILSLLEIKYDGSIANSIELKNHWSNITVYKNQDGNIVYNFTSVIQKDSNNETISSLTYLIEEVSNNKVYSFGGIEFKVSAGSIKVTATISNYQFSSNLNTLKLLLESSVKNNIIDNNNCNNPNVDINSISNGDNIENTSTLNYITIKKDEKILTGRFLDRIEVDQPGRFTFITSEIVNKTDNSVIVAINLPHCIQCTLDPDFSVLVSSQFKSSCDSNKKWILPVAIVVPVVAVSIIIVAFILISRNRLSRLNIAIKLKKLVK